MGWGLRCLLTLTWFLGIWWALTRFWIDLLGLLPLHWSGSVALWWLFHRLLGTTRRLYSWMLRLTFCAWVGCILLLLLRLLRIGRPIVWGYVLLRGLLLCRGLLRLLLSGLCSRLAILCRCIRMVLHCIGICWSLLLSRSYLFLWGLVSRGLWLRLLMLVLCCPDGRHPWTAWCVCTRWQSVHCRVLSRVGWGVRLRGGVFLGLWSCFPWLGGTILAIFLLGMVLCLLC